jgi:hypothetical protein
MTGARKAAGVCYLQCCLLCGPGCKSGGAELQSPCLTLSVCGNACCGSLCVLVQWYYQQFGDFLMDSPPQWFRILIL